MPTSEDFLTNLLVRRGDLYEQLQLMDSDVADAQRSPFFGTVADNEPKARNSIARVEGQISAVDRQIAGLRGRNA